MAIRIRNLSTHGFDRNSSQIDVFPAPISMPVYALADALDNGKLTRLQLIVTSWDWAYTSLFFGVFGG
jgi:hypothetical protein